MKASELRQKTVQELNKIERDLHKEGFSLQMQKATGQLNKTDQIKKVRKNIARIYTVITEKGKQL